MASAAAELITGTMAGTLSRALRNGANTTVKRLSDSAPREVVDDIYSSALKKQTGMISRLFSPVIPERYCLGCIFVLHRLKPLQQNPCWLVLTWSCLGAPLSVLLLHDAGVSLKYMLDFGQNPIERQLMISAQFLHKELPVRLAHRVAELENLPFGLSAKSPVLKVTSGTGHQACCTAPLHLVLSNVLITVLYTQQDLVLWCSP